MPATAPVLHYVLREDFTPAHRAQLSKSHKKVEQLLGVTPSVCPIPPPPPPPPKTLPPSPPPNRHHRSKSCVSETPRRTKLQKRERGRVWDLFGIDVNNTVLIRTEDEEEAEAFLHHRVSTDSCASDCSSPSSYSSSDGESLPDIDEKATRYHRHRRPSLHIVCSNPDEEEFHFDDISPKMSASDSPISPLYGRGKKREMSRFSMIAENEWEREVVNGPISQKEEKTRKLNRLGKVFGTMPPLEMVFPPTPTSRSRFDPQRYSLELPPPLVRGTLEDDVYERHDRRSGLIIEIEGEDEEVMRVDWDLVVDEDGRRRVMDVLRMLRN